MSNNTDNHIFLGFTIYKKVKIDGSTIMVKKK
jgi:hypothetical protein